MLTDQDVDRIADAVVERLTNHSDKTSLPKSLLDVHYAAKVLGCSVPTVERLTRSGALPSLKIGRLRRYRLEDLVGEGRQSNTLGTD